jgi:hypothetical protein
MGQTKKQRKAARRLAERSPSPPALQPRSSHPAVSRKSAWLAPCWPPLILLLAVFGFAAWLLIRSTKTTAATEPIDLENPSLEQLLRLSPEQLGKVDIAVMNLRCAEGISGSEGLDIRSALTALDRYAKQVEAETTRNFYRYRRNPAEFQNSEPYFRLLMMAVVMQEDFNVHYNPRLMASPEQFDPNDGFSDDARNVFLNGLTGPPLMGTCASMPVLYVAVGRRLGYPLYLVSTKGHLFARWDDGRTRLNMEGTSHGFGSYDDDYYKTFPVKVSDDEIVANRYLVSMSPNEELACFLASRCACVLTMSKYAYANWCIHEAARLAPNVHAYKRGIEIVQQELMDFRMRQVEQATWSPDEPSEAIPAGLRHSVRKRKISP